MGILAQIFSILGMSTVIFSYQNKNKTRILLFQVVGAMFFCISYLMLGAYIGAFISFFALLRSLVYAFGERFRIECIVWPCIFSILFIFSYILSFTVFAKEPKLFTLIAEALPVAGQILFTFGFRAKNTKTVRRVAAVAHPLIMLYNIYAKSLGGTISDGFCVVSVIIATIRFEKRNKRNA